MSSTGAQVTGGWSLLAGLLAALALAGCGPTAEIETYETPRGERLAPLTLGDLRASLDHMFAAVAPARQPAWFFKMVVPAAAADELRQPFLDFLATVDVEAVGDKLPAWRVPDGWRPGAPRAMVDATFVVPYPGGEAELTVSSLPMGENWSEYLHQNVERWLGQL
ncbi:MAG TPA: hypothetical protein PJ982_11680, partial [Lacipirellulaceae bacterium]|nr:hypothetical protein [Lacipirellulaceae bacterium]